MTEEQLLALGLEEGWNHFNTTLWCSNFFIYGTQILLPTDYNLPTVWLVKDCDSHEEAISTLLLIRVLSP